MADFDPYLKWLGIRDPVRPVNHYRLLGIDMFESDPDVITIAADRQMSHIRTYQAGPNGALSQKILNELSRARRCLLVPEKKSAYDQKLASSVKAPVPIVTPVVSSALSSPPQIQTTPDHGGHGVEVFAPTKRPSAGGVSIKQDPNARSKIKKREKKELMWTLVGWVSGALAAVGVSAWLIASGMLGNIELTPDIEDENRTPRSIAKVESQPPSETVKSSDPPNRTTNPKIRNTDNQSTSASTSKNSDPRDSANMRAMIDKAANPNAAVETPTKNLPSNLPESLPKKERLTQIAGIGPKTQENLYKGGITTFVQLANSTPEAIHKVMTQAGAGEFSTVESSKSWIHQAKKIAGIEPKVATESNNGSFFPKTPGSSASPKTVSNTSSLDSIRPPGGRFTPPAASTTTPSRKEKLPEPSGAVIRDASKEVIRLYPSIATARYNWTSKKDLGSLVRVAEELLDDAREFNNNPDVLYGLLDTARNIGIAVGDAKLAINALRQMDQAFKIDYWDKANETIEATAPNANSYTERNFKLTIDALIEEAKAAEQFDAAKDLINRAEKMAIKARDTDARKHYKAQDAQIKELKKFADKNETAVAVLKTNPDDFVANLNHGHYLFVSGKADEAFDKWAKSGNANWIAIAKLETSSDRSNPKALVQLAKSWKELGMSKKPTALERKCLIRALDLFEKAKRDLKGLEKRFASNEATDIQKKLKE